MRQPTDINAALEWHRRSLAGEVLPVIETEPQIGWYRRKFVKGGPWVPGRIWIHQVLDFETDELAEPEEIRCEVNQRRADPIRQWEQLCKHPISEGSFNRMVRLIEWAGSHDPTNPILQPNRPVDPTERAPRPRGL